MRWWSPWRARADLAYMAESHPRQMALHLSRLLDMSRKRPSQIHHVYYKELMADAGGAMHKLYAEPGPTMTPQVEVRMDAYLKANPQGKYGAHAYALDDWGLTKKDLRPYFAEYLKAHPVATAA